MSSERSVKDLSGPYTCILWSREWELSWQRLISARGKLPQARMTTKEFKRPTHPNKIGRRIEETTIKAVIEHTDGVRLQVDFGHDQTALVEL
jgi:hypothetical protein